MQLPLQLLASLERAKGFDKEAFETVHYSPSQVTSIRLNPAKPALQVPGFPLVDSRVPWTEYGYYLSHRPSFTFDPLFHAGCYYVQEASSMFLEQALKQTIDLSRPIRVLDLCAAPGGKSTHIQSLISEDSLVVSNEVIRSRANVLTDNMMKWGSGNVVVTNNDPADFKGLHNYFDVIVVDAPCSGSGLFRRDPDAIDEWSENNVQLCSQRQRRILADVLPALKKGGVLVYSTCSYSMEEDEEMVKWFVSGFPVDQVSLAINPQWNIIDAGDCYRFWPDKVKGEGFFLACFRKNDGDGLATVRSKPKASLATKNDMQIIGKWVETTGRVFVKHLDKVYCWPQTLADDFFYLLHNLKVIYSGILAGELLRDKLIPGHSLAMSNIVAKGVEAVELDTGNAIRYLQRKDLVIEGKEKGWYLVNFSGFTLGWINVLQNRVNNYYPKELRILKEN